MRIVAALLLVVALAGCTSAPPTPEPTGSSTPAPSAAPLVPELEPVVPETLDADTAETETVRLADTIQSLIDGTDIVNVDDHSQLNTDAAASFYGVIRTITLSPETDPMLLAESMVGILTASGWRQDESTIDDALSLVALDQGGWFLLLGGDATVEGQSVITLQLASPDLP